MIYVSNTETFENVDSKYENFEKSFLEKTKDTIKGLRKTLTKQMADEISDSIMNDLKNDMYATFLDFAQDLWKESLEYILGKSYTKGFEDKRTFKDYIQTVGYEAESLRKKIYEDNKEEIKRAITCDYLYDTLEYFFYNSGYWKGVDLKFTEPYTQYRVMEAFMKRLAIDSMFDEALSDLVDNSIMEKKNQLYKLEEEIKQLSKKLSDLIGDEEVCE